MTLNPAVDHLFFISFLTRAMTCHDYLHHVSFTFLVSSLLPDLE
jgi:hypothetical protein